MGLELRPISFRDACAFIRLHHRHHPAPRGWKFGVAAARDGEVVGVVMVGRPVARLLDDGSTLEVTRLCTIEEASAKNAASLLYSVAWRAARALGYHRLITYTLCEEAGVSLRAAGWRPIRQTRGGTWSRPSRPRATTSPTGSKVLWEAPVGGERSRS
jgi:hypothetical protein